MPAKKSTSKGANKTETAPEARVEDMEPEVAPGVPEEDAVREAEPEAVGPEEPGIEPEGLVADKPKDIFEDIPEEEVRRAEELIAEVRRRESRKKYDLTEDGKIRFRYPSFSEEKIQKMRSVLLDKKAYLRCFACHTTFLMDISVQENEACPRCGTRGKVRSITSNDVRIAEKQILDSLGMKEEDVTL